MAESSVIVIELKAEDRLLLDRTIRWRKLSFFTDVSVLALLGGAALAHLFGWL